MHASGSHCPVTKETPSEILQLGEADAHYQRTGMWPKRNSGPIVEAPAKHGLLSTWP